MELSIGSVAFYVEYGMMEDESTLHYLFHVLRSFTHRGRPSS